eukprot:CAMPEP_0181365684 /NCGR_PEP_ID=MMETSP1106-20121128/10226_1 /TAXON_ID=81844 /ORGANISM="Mantoniella antarctica, Strain SL-175" /LENGTH=47 /DNA_ID= /DNA_START= /DNA_END= /DNA_ORIENTATION=
MVVMTVVSLRMATATAAAVVLVALEAMPEAILDNDVEVKRALALCCA